MEGRAEGVSPGFRQLSGRGTPTGRKAVRISSDLTHLELQGVSNAEHPFTGPPQLKRLGPIQAVDM